MQEGDIETVVASQLGFLTHHEIENAEIIIITLKCRSGYNQQSHYFTLFHYNFLTLEGEFIIKFYC